MVLLLLSPGSWGAQSFVCPLEEYVSPVLCKFWQLYGGVNGNLLQEGLCHTPVCCTQSPCPCSRPLLTHASTKISGHSQAGLVQSLVGSLLLSPGSWCSQVFFVCVPSKSLFPVLCKFWQLYGGINGNFLQEGLCHTQVYFTQSP